MISTYLEQFSVFYDVMAMRSQASPLLTHHYKLHSCLFSWGRALLLGRPVCIKTMKSHRFAVALAVLRQSAAICQRRATYYRYIALMCGVTPLVWPWQTVISSLRSSTAAAAQLSGNAYMYIFAALLHMHQVLAINSGPMQETQTHRVCATDNCKSMNSTAHCPEPRAKGPET